MELSSAKYLISLTRALIWLIMGLGIGVSGYFINNITTTTNNHNNEIEKITVINHIYLPEGVENSCLVGYLVGVCSYALECYNSGRHAESVCRKGFSFGVCCTDRTTLSAIKRNEQFPNSREEADCGTLQISTSLKSRVVNGIIGLYGQFPWTVSLRMSVDPDDKTIPSRHFCGATLLNNDWVATSAHCMFQEQQHLYTVLRLGEYISTSAIEPHKYVERKIVMKIMHPNFRVHDYYSDIALLKMDAPVTFQFNIQPICLPGNRDLLAGQSGIVSGWGTLKEGEGPSEIINMVSLPIITNEECEDMFIKGRLKEDIYDVFLCAGYEDGLQDACTGDSGGPLQVKGKDGRVFLAGIVSWGYGCSRPLKPGVYTRISEFVPWILERILTL